MPRLFIQTWWRFKVYFDSLESCTEYFIHGPTEGAAWEGINEYFRNPANGVPMFIGNPEEVNFNCLI